MSKKLYDIPKKWRNIYKRTCKDIVRSGEDEVTPSFERADKYVPVGRNLLLVDKKKKGYKKNYVCYKRDVASISHVVPRRGTVPDRVVEREDKYNLINGINNLTIPVDGDSSIIAVSFFEIASNPQKRFRENIPWKNILNKAEEAIWKSEDTEILREINSAVRKTQTVSCKGSLNISILSYAFQMIRNHDLKVSKMVVHPQETEDLILLGEEVFIPNSEKKFKKTGCVGKVVLGRRNIKVYETHRQQPGDILVLAPADKVGVIPVKNDISFLYADNPKNLSQGRVLWESIGIGILNDYAVAKIVIVPDCSGFSTRKERDISHIEPENELKIDKEQTEIKKDIKKKK